MKLFTKDISETERVITLLNGTQLMVAGLDKPERIEGITFPPVKGILITEMANQKPDMWGAHVEPILADNEGWAILNGVPDGKNHWYDMCLIPGQGVIPEVKPIEGAFAKHKEFSFHAWYSSDVLPARMIERAKRSLDEITFKQEYEASFEGYAGLAYYAFSERNHRECRRIMGLSLDIGMDFNVDPMCCTVGS